jgi:hypothetical protein
MRKKTALIVLSLVLAACSSVEKSEVSKKTLPSLPSYSSACPDERPQMCTFDFNPVCATKSSGETHTYSNACSACANVSVQGYSEGECQ